MVHIRTSKNVMFSVHEKNSAEKHPAEKNLPDKQHSPKIDKFPEKLTEKKIKEDCIECRYIGSAAFFGISGYMAYLYMNTPKNAKSQRAFLAVCGIGKLSF